MSDTEIEEEELRTKIEESGLSFFFEKALSMSISTFRQKENKDVKMFNISQTTRTDPALLKNKIFNFASAEDSQAALGFLKDSTNLELSNLVPYIRIFKVFKQKGVITELELPFDDYTNKNDLDSMYLTKTGRGAGLGLTSFEWKSMAKNEANMAQFSAQLKLFVQDVTELEKIRNIDDKGNSVTLLDLIYPQVRQDTTGDAGRYDKEQLSLKMLVGWHPQSTSDAIQNYTLTPFFMTLIKHNFDFQEDGSIIVTIDFIASIELDFNDPLENNCLMSDLDIVQTRMSKLLKKWKLVIDLVEDNKDPSNLKRKELQDLYSKEINFIINKLSTSKKVSTSVQGDLINQKRYPLAQDDADKLKEKKEEVTEILKNVLLEEKINILKDSLLHFTANNRILTLVVDEENIKKLTKIYSYGSLTVLDPDAVLAIQQTGTSDLSNTGINTPTINNDDIIDAVNDGRSEGEPIKAEQLSEKIIENIRDNLQNVNNADDAAIIPFIPLYEIINYYVKKTGFYRENKIILGNFTYKSYNLNNKNLVSTFKKIKVKEEDGTTEEKVIQIINLQPKVSNIGAIPISLTSYINWFTSNFLEKDIKKISIGKFINKLLKELVPLNINTKFIKFFPSYKFSASSYPFTVDEEKFKKAITLPNKCVVDDALFHNIKKYSPREKNKKLSKFLFILSENEDNISLEGNFNKDWNDNGIYHFYIGEETGLVKTISFAREDNPRLEAAQLQAANPENNAEIVRHIYSATLELFGNTFFEPGHLIYINPTYPGVGIRNTSLFKIGLGGYYRVITVNSFIESGVYKTTLSCKWEAFGQKQEEFKPDLSNIDNYEGIQLG